MTIKHLSALEVINKLRTQEISRCMLSKEQILECMTLLLLDGTTNATLAALFQCSERTITRLKSDIRARNLFQFDLQDCLETIGEYKRSVEHQLKRLMRIAASAKTDAEKIQAGVFIVKLWNDYMKTLVLLGCMSPTIFEHKEKLALPPAPEPTLNTQASIDWQKAHPQFEEFLKAFALMPPTDREILRQSMIRLEKVQKKKAEQKEHEEIKAELRRKNILKDTEAPKSDEPDYYI